VNGRNAKVAEHWCSITSGPQQVCKQRNCGLHDFNTFTTLEKYAKRAPAAATPLNANLSWNAQRRLEISREPSAAPTFCL